MPKKSALTDREFNAAIIIVGYGREVKVEKIELARKVLVRGESVASVARLAGLNKQTVAYTVTRIKMAFDLLHQANEALKK